MLISLVLLILLAAGGLPLTYVSPEDRPLMWRIAAGNIIGCVIFSSIAFVLACFFGLTVPVVVVSLAISLLPLGLMLRPDFRSRLRRDWQSAAGKLQGASIARFASLFYYAFFAVLFWFFFGESMYVTAQGIYTGGSQNMGDLPYHLGAIYSFTDGNNFPPENPSWAGARFSYPFIADLLTACFMRLGADIVSAMHLQGVAWALSLLVILERFTLSLTQSKFAARTAPFVLFFSGGLGFLWFGADYWQQGKGLLDFLRALPADYTISDDFRWGNSLIVLFITQRSLLLGMPLTILVLGFLWKVFDRTPDTKSSDADEIRDDAPALAGFPLLPAFVGLLAGTLPLVHLLFVVTAFLFALRPARWKEWAAFGVGVAIIAVPELAWSLSGTANRASEFVGWNLGWDNGEVNIVWFWIKNTGLTLPLLLIGIFVLFRREDSRARNLLLFYLPFAFLFLVSNTVRLAPWEWDNIKVLIYWFVPTAAIVAFAVAWIWKRGKYYRIAALACAFVLCFSGALDVWRTASSQNDIRIYDADGVKIAEQIKAKTEPDALFLNAPTYNSPIALTGRQSYMRYTGHLLSHGIEYRPREDEVRRIYEGGGVSDILLKQASIDYVLISPEERNSVGARDEVFAKYPLVAQSGEYRVYKVR
jgi:hypothetical protein